MLRWPAGLLFLAPDLAAAPDPVGGRAGLLPLLAAGAGAGAAAVSSSGAHSSSTISDMQWW